MAEHPMPYGASERRAGLATGPQLRYLSDGDLLPMRINDGSELLPALPSVPPTPEPPAIETRTAQRTPNREADLIVPAGQAASSIMRRNAGLSVVLPLKPAST